MNDSVSRAKPFIPEYAPVPLNLQIAEVRKQLAITNNVLNKKLARDAIHPVAAAAEIQCLQSALRTLEAIAEVAGGDTKLSPDEWRRRLVILPEKPQ